jgi:hypothetical protein
MTALLITAFVTGLAFLASLHRSPKPLTPLQLAVQSVWVGKVWEGTNFQRPEEEQ